MHRECRCSEDVFVEGEEIRLEGERRVDHDSLFFQMADLACPFQISGLDFISIVIGILRFKEAKEACVHS